MAEATPFGGPFESLLEASPDAIVIVDASGRLVLANRQFENVFGHARRDIIGQPVERLLPADARARHASQRAHYAQDMQARRLGSERPLRALRQDGTEIPVEVILTPLRTAAGEYVAAVVRDASQREHAAQLFCDLLEAAPDAMVVVNAQGNIQLVNAQTECMFGYARQELIGASVELLLPEPARALHQLHRARFHESPHARTMGEGRVLRARRKDGSALIVEVSLSPMHSSHGTLVTAAIRDVSERTRREDARRSAVEEESRRKSELVANMSHELRTPLNAIIGFAKLMHHGRVGMISDQQREYLGDILNASNHLMQLISETLELAKMDAGRVEFVPETLDILQLLHEVRDTFRALSAAKQITFEVNADAACVGVELDRSKLKQVLLNYVANAIKFTEPRGCVKLSARPESETEVRFEVSDSGVGIRAADLPSLFVEFRELAVTPTKRAQTTGLGLALTKRIVEAQGGRVGATSVYGQGSTFYAVLPVKSRPGASV